MCLKRLFSFSAIPGIAWVLTSMFMLVPNSAEAQWFDQGSDSTNKAKELPSFKPDSVLEAGFNKLDRGISERDSLTQKRDSLEAIDERAAFSKRGPYLAVHAGISFLDFDGTDRFSKVLQNESQNAGRKIRQPYETVMMVFPLGLAAGLRLFPYVDISAKTHSFYSRQSAVIADTSRNGSTKEKFYALHGHFLGLGLRLFIPPAIFQATGEGPVYFEVMRFWSLPGTGVYANSGSAEAKSSPWGQAMEFQLGFQHKLSERLTWVASLGYFTFDMKTDTPQSELWPGEGNSNVTLSGNSIQLRAYGIWNLSPIANIAD